MNDSMALSGCSLSRKLSPRKYESGNARDSRNRCLMSMRAAIHPMAKNSAGMGSSHQSSKSMEASTPTHKFAYMPESTPRTERAKRTAAIARAMARMSDKAIGDADRFEHSKLVGRGT